MDVFGRDEVFNESGKNDTNFFRYLIPEDFEKAYHKALQEGWGLNAMDALRDAFIAKGLDKENKELYQKISNYADKLSKNGALTEKEANEAEKGENKTTNTDKENKKKKPGFAALVIGVIIAATASIALFIARKVKERKQEKSKNT